MVAVMIISVVIMALIQTYANNAHLFGSIKKQIKTNQYASLLISNVEYGFEKKHLSMYDLVKEFDVESDLKRSLKEQKVDILYQEKESLDLGEIALEIGSSTLKTDEFSSALLRFRIK